MADWDENSPSDSDFIAQFPANERAARAALVANFGVDHEANAADANIGKHVKVSLVDQSSDPAGAANSSTLYAKDVSGASQLFWRSEAGPAVQLTAAGGLRAESLVGTVADARLSGNVPLKNAFNAYSNLQRYTLSGGAGTVMQFSNADAPENRKNFSLSVAANNGAIVLSLLNDSFTGIESFFTLTRNSDGTGNVMALLADSITLNGVNVTDYARLSQQNTFTGATQTVSAANANWFATNGTVGVKIQALSTDNTGLVGTQTNHPLHFIVNNTPRGSVGTDGSFHLPVVATSTSTTLTAGRVHAVTGNATLPNMAAGQWVGVINDSASPITVTKNASDTMYWTASGASVTSVTVAARGKVTFFAASDTNVYASGNITGSS